MTEERKVLGFVYRVTARFLAERGLKERIAPALSPETLALIEKPPFGFSWRSGKALEEIERGLCALPGGSDLCTELGTAASLDLCGSVIQGVVRTSFLLFGQSPATLFANADRFFQMVTTGIAFRYEPAQANAGVVFATIGGGAVHSSLFDQIRGNLKGAYALCGVEGEVGAPEVCQHEAQGALVKYAVRWNPG